MATWIPEDWLDTYSARIIAYIVERAITIDPKEAVQGMVELGVIKPPTKWYRK